MGFEPTNFYAVTVSYGSSVCLLLVNILKAKKLSKKQVADTMNVWVKPNVSAIAGPVRHPMPLPAPNNPVNNPVFPRGITSMDIERTETEYKA